MGDKEKRNNKIKGHPATLKRGAKVPKITEKILRFVEEYCIDGVQTAAAVRAGYSPNSAHGIANALLKREDVQALIAERRAAYRDECKVTHEMITAELMKIAFSDTNDFLEIKGEGDAQTVVFKPTSALSKGNGRIIKTIKVGRRGIELSLHSKEQAIDMLARHTGYFKVDNEQKKTEGVAFYLPENGRDDVIDSEAEETPQTGE